jgi:hypothetical protein
MKSGSPTSSSIVLVGLTSLLLLFTFSFSSTAASAQPSASAAGKFLFYGMGGSGSFALGAGVIGQTSQVKGEGMVFSSKGGDGVLFSLTGTAFCSGGPPPGVPCLGLQGTVKSTVGQGVNDAVVGDTVVVLLVQSTANSGSICVIIPAPGLSGACDNFVGTVVIP